VKRAGREEQLGDAMWLARKLRDVFGLRSLCFVALAKPVSATLIDQIDKNRRLAAIRPRFVDSKRQGHQLAQALDWRVSSFRAWEHWPKWCCAAAP
jgi:hypothetical protein